MIEETMCFCESRIVSRRLVRKTRRWEPARNLRTRIAVVVAAGPSEAYLAGRPTDAGWAAGATRGSSAHSRDESRL